MSANLAQFQSNYISIERNEATVILNARGDFFRAITDLGQIELLAKFYKSICRDTDLKTLIIHPDLSDAGVNEYIAFFGEGQWRHIDELHRFYNVLDQIIVNLIELDKLVIHTCKGDVLSILMNIGLACDYRIVADNTVFHHAFHRRGMLPKGGSPFFLSRLLGGGKAIELLLLNRKIDAATALSQGIVDRVVPPENLKQEALEVARRFNEIPHRTLMGVKRLVNFSSKDLKEYLTFESREIGQIIRSRQIAHL